MIPYILAVAVGYGIAKVVENLSENENEFYTIFIRTKDFGKQHLNFKNLDGALKEYKFIEKHGVVIYHQIVDNSKEEKELFEKWEREGNIGKEGYPKLTDKSKVSYIDLISTIDGKETKLMSKKFN